VNRIRLTFQPTQAYSVTGFIAIGVDPDPSYVSPGSVSTVIRHDPSTLGDIKDRHEICWTPDDDIEQLDHLVNTGNASSSNATSISQGTIQIYTENSAGNGNNLGFLFYEVDIEFWGLD